MDARDRLRLYLEQRRDLGESELIFDSLTVDEVMRAIGALGASEGEPRPEIHSVRNAHETTSRQLDSRATPAAVRNAAAVTLGSQSAQGIVAGGDAAELFSAELMRLPSLGAIADAVEGCTRCPLCKTATRGVPGDGAITARLVCVGEAPGANEDATGKAFVGQAGQLLTKILAAVDLSREQVFITNVVKHRPPGNRNPAPDEIAACSPYLVRQLELIQPKVIVAFGTFAAQTLLNTRTAIGKLRGEIHRYHGIPLVVTYHPAALLRNPAWKRPTWEDVQLARRILDSAAVA